MRVCYAITNDLTQGLLPGKYFIEVILLLSFESSSSEVYGRFSELLTYAVVGWWLAGE